MPKRMLMILFSCVLLFGLGGCAQQDGRLIDGYYTAELSEYSHGWKEFLTICVSDGKIVTAEYNAKNQSGFIKAWDMTYMRNMNSVQGTYPNRYTRSYAAFLLKTQSAEGIDTVTGASSSGSNFRILVETLIEKAKAGDTDLAVVESGE